VLKKKKKKFKQTKTTNLIANGRFQIWWPLEKFQCLEVHGEASLLVVQWKGPNLIALGFFHV
jgi:hypothetical protein